MSAPARQASLFTEEEALLDVVTQDHEPGTRLRVAVTADGARVVLLVLDAQGKAKNRGLRLTPTQARTLGMSLQMGWQRATQIADEASKRGPR